MDHFRAPRFDTPLDLDAHLAAIPEGTTIKGMFASDVVKLVRDRTGKSPGREKFVAFKDYDFKEWVRLLVTGAEMIHPDVPIHEAIRRVGHLAYPTFFSSLAGRVLLSVVGKDPLKLIPLVPKIYAMTASRGRAKVAEIEPGRALIELRDVWDFPESYNVGNFEGAMRAFEVEGKIELQTFSACDADILLTWRPA